MATNDGEVFDFVGARERRELLTAAEAAEILGVAPKTIRNLRYKGLLRTEAYGGTIFVWRDSINPYMKSIKRPTMKLVIDPLKLGQ